MISIIAGEVNGGKSTKFLQLFHESENSTGLWSQKTVTPDNQVAGYQLVLLPQNIELPFATCLADDAVIDTTLYYSQGSFLFLKKIFDLASQHILNNKADKSVWIDEVGNLKLSGKGFDSLLRTLIAQQTHLTITVRNHLLQKVIAHYEIADYQILNV